MKRLLCTLALFAFCAAASAFQPAVDPLDAPATDSSMYAADINSLDLDHGIAAGDVRCTMPAPGSAEVSAGMLNNDVTAGNTMRAYVAHRQRLRSGNGGDAALMVYNERSMQNGTGWAGVTTAVTEVGSRA